MADSPTPNLRLPRSGPANPAPFEDAPTQLDLSSPQRSPGKEDFPKKFGSYELLSEIARGGMGIVYRAVQNELNRTVALKMILAGKLAEGDDVIRFRTEAEAAARLQHPSIVSVFEVGEVDGNHFFSMELIEGVSLSQKLDNGPLPGRFAARYVQILAEAVEYAHRQGIVHRDLKPSNILLDTQDQPHITDFGLAKRFRENSGHTRTGAVLGTPSYMAPEQAQGKTRELGPACDIYSLGAILYELLTGRPPFQAETAYDTVMQVIQNEPVPPRLLNSMIDEDLETICLKCLEKDPKLRYESAQELSFDLKRYLHGESISARSFNVFDRLTRMLDRSHHVVAFHAWSSMLFIWAGVIAVEHILVFFLMRSQQPQEFIFAARFMQFAILGFLFWYNRGNSLLPTTSIERDLWTIWIGYFATYAIGIGVTKSLIRMQVVQAGPNAPPDYMTELLPYPFVILFTGMALFIMGNNYWGRCYAFGLAFFLLAAVVPMNLTWAPLGYGLLWSIVLTELGLHLRKLGREFEAEKKLSNSNLKAWE